MKRLLWGGGDIDLLYPYIYIYIQQPLDPEIQIPPSLPQNIIVQSCEQAAASVPLEEDKDGGEHTGSGMHLDLGVSGLGCRV